MTRAYTGTLRCPRCGTGYSEPAAHVVCPNCAGEGIHVFPAPVYDLTELTGLPVGASPGIFRFADLLPVGAGPIVSLGEGTTPLLPINDVGRATGITDLWWKDESRNPTWSYKDRLAAAAITKAAQDSAETVVVSSTGNHGASIAAYAAQAGLRCVVLTLASVPQAMKTLMQSFGAVVVALERPADRWVVMRAAIEERGWVPMSGYVAPPSGSNPYGVDGYKTIAYELYEQTGGKLPHVIVAPVAYGDGITGLVHGFEDLVALGLADRIPRVVAAEPYGPLAAALRGRDGLERDAEPTVAFSVAATTPTWQARHAVEVSGGSAMSADDEMIMGAQRLLAARSGLYAEASSAMTIAVLPRLLKEGLIDPAERVVLLGTSTGLKDVAATAARLPAVQTIEPTLASFDQATAEATTA